MTPAPVLPPSPRDRATSAHRVARFTLACALLLALAVPSVLLAGGAAPGAPAWSGETLGTASTLPVQDGGRVMPLHTYAGFTLLKLNHKRTAKDAADHTLPPIAVLLDLLFRPRVAIEYPIFVVDDAAVLDTVGLQHAGKDKRDRYSYAELEPGRDALFRLAKSYRVLPAENRTAVQGGVVDLVQNLRLFESLGSYLGFSRGTFEVSKFPGAEPFFGTATQLGYLDVLRRAKDLLALAAGTDAAEIGRAHV